MPLATMACQAVCQADGAVPAITDLYHLIQGLSLTRFGPDQPVTVGMAGVLLDRLLPPVPSPADAVPPVAARTRASGCGGDPPAPGAGGYAPGPPAVGPPPGIPPAPVPSARSSRLHSTASHSAPDQEAVSAVVAVGLLTGVGSGQFQPLSTVIRAQMAVVLDRIPQDRNGAPVVSNRNSPSRSPGGFHFCTAQLWVTMARKHPPSVSPMKGAKAMIKTFSELRKTDAASAGGKGANLGELTATGVPVPPGFVILADTYEQFLQETGLGAELDRLLGGIPIENTEELGRRATAARQVVLGRTLPVAMAEAIRSAVTSLGPGPLAVRSSATMEDSAVASFAGANESFLNVEGEKDVLRRVQDCWASLFSPRSLYYRVRQGYSASQALIAVVVQRQIASEKSGVMFTLDPLTGQTDRIVIEGAFGLGEAVVSGQVSPDRYVIAKAGMRLLERHTARKVLRIVALPEGGTRREDLTASPLADAPVLRDEEIRDLAELGLRIEAHYQSAQDIEWTVAEDQIRIVQSRPITVAARSAAPSPSPEPAASGTETVRVRGVPASPGRAVGKARVLRSLQGEDRLAPGEILVTSMTSPDWVPLMKKAAAIVTDEGGATSHAAIVSRELGIPAIVGTGNATAVIHSGDALTVDADRGLVLEGDRIPLRKEALQSAAPAVLTSSPITGTNLYVNLSQPSRVREVAAMPVDGVGLLRAEFILTEALGHRHPRLLLEEGREEEFISRLADSLREFAVAFHPRPVVYRASDFKTNEYRHLEGGERFEPREENPMLGYRGAYRYGREPELFALELRALLRVRREYQLPNVTLMLPFVRTIRDLSDSLRVIDQEGLREDRGFKLWVMAEVPSVLFLLPEYARLGVQGVSIGSNDLTQLLLGLDRDGQEVADLFDERDPAVMAALKQIITMASDLGLTSSICGQAPSVYPEVTEAVVRAGITSVSVNPDAALRTRQLIAATERRLLLAAARKSL